jgi:hypothetical protein
MESRITESIWLQNHAVAILWSNDAPEDALQFKAGHWGCVMSMLATVATKGKTAVFDRETFGCWGGGVGLGFGNQYEVFPGGIDGFYRFLSNGNETDPKGKQIGEAMAERGGAQFADDFLRGERYLKDPACTKRFVSALPILEIPAKYVIAKPLASVDPAKDQVKSVTFFVEPDALSALVILANHTHPEFENVAIPWAAACQVMGILAYHELQRDHPRALVGLTDISARKSTRASLGKNALSFTAPWPVFLEMENSVEGSFLKRETWYSLLAQ